MMRRRFSSPRSGALGIVVVAALGVVACPQFKDDPTCAGESCVGDAGAPGIDATVDASAKDAEKGAEKDAGKDAAIAIDAGSGSGPVVSDGSSPTLAVTTFVSGFGDVTTQTGRAQQRHLVYASASGRYFLFYLDAAAQFSLKVRSTADFATWREETAFDLPSLPHSNEGRNLSAATAVLNGVDVIHVILSLYESSGDGDNPHQTYHLRARITSSGFGWTGITQVSDLRAQLGFPTYPHCDPDGPDVTITPTGVVLDATGWQAWPTSACDANVFVAANVDDGGASWSPDFPKLPSLPFYLPVNDTSNAHGLTALPSGDVIGLFANGADVAGPDDVAWSRSLDRGGLDAAAGADAAVVEWPRLRNVFPVTGSQSANDWSSCLTADSILHLVRRVENSPDGFDHARYDGTSWSAAGTIPSASAERGSGVVLLNKGNEMILFAFGSDGSLQSLAWDGTAWETVWHTVLPAGPPRTGLGGSGCGSPPVLLWTEGAPGSLAVVGARVDSLFQ